jgi:hypothetical protein
LSEPLDREPAITAASAAAPDGIAMSCSWCCCCSCARLGGIASLYGVQRDVRSPLAPWTLGALGDG